MLDIGWSEFMVIGALALIIIGPRELPGALRTLGRVVSKARAMANDFRDGLDDIARESELKDIGENMIGGGEDWFDDPDPRSNDAAEAENTALDGPEDEAASEWDARSAADSNASVNADGRAFNDDDESAADEADAADIADNSRDAAEAEATPEERADDAQGRKIQDQT